MNDYGIQYFYVWLIIGIGMDNIQHILSWLLDRELSHVTQIWWQRQEIDHQGSENKKLICYSYSS